MSSQVFLGLPKDFQHKFLIYPPTVKQVVSNPNFSYYRTLLTTSQEELEDIYIKDNKKKDFTDYNKFEVPTPFQYLLINSYNNKQIESLVKEAFYFFTKQEIEFLYEEKAILIDNLEDELQRVNNNLKLLVLLTEEDFFDFQNEIRMALGEEPIERPDPSLHPKIRRMKALTRYRDKVKAKKGAGISFETTLVSICCMGIGITPLNIGELSYASLFEIVSTYQNKEKYEKVKAEKLVALLEWAQALPENPHKFRR